MENERTEIFVVYKKVDGQFRPKRAFLSQEEAQRWGGEKEFGVIGIPEFKVMKMSLENKLEDFEKYKDTGNLKAFTIIDDKDKEFLRIVKIFASEVEASDFLDDSNDLSLDQGHITIVIQNRE